MSEHRSEEVDSLLRRQGQAWQSDFTPPPMPPLVGEPRSRMRWAGPLIAAILLLAIPLVTITAIGHHTRTTATVAYQPPPIPDTIVEKGKTLHRESAVRWLSPVLARDGVTLTVSADVNDLFSCGVLPIRAFVTEENSGSVDVEVVSYGSDSTASPTAGVATACSDVGHSPEPVSVRLSQPLAGRGVIDTDSQVSHPVLDAATVLAPTYLPAGYGAGTLSWDETGRTTSTEWSYPDGTKPTDTLTVERLVLPGLKPYQEHILLAHANVLGRDATVYQDASFTDLTCVRWIDADHAWRVCSSGSPTAPLGAAELLKTANSLR